MNRGHTAGGGYVPRNKGHYEPCWIPEEIENLGKRARAYERDVRAALKESDRKGLESPQRGILEEARRVVDERGVIYGPPLPQEITTHESGMNRTVEAGKPDYTLLSWELIDAWAVHMTAAVESHGHNNWRKAATQEDLDRAIRSAYRHFRSVMRNEADEDHISALVYNLGIILQIRALDASRESGST